MTSRPSSVSSCARIEPVQPRPMIATSLWGSLRAIVRPSGLAWIPIPPSHEADGRMWVALVMTLNPGAILVTGAGIADHSPRAHVTIAAVNRVGEKSLVHVCQQLFEERLPVDAVQFRRAAL